MAIAGCACQSLECLDVLVKIFVQLSPGDVVSCALTCKLWQRAAGDVALWRHFCLQRWPSLSDPAARPCLSRIRSFAAFFSQRASNAVDPDATRWLLFLHSTTLLIDVSLADRPLFSAALAGSDVAKERLRFKLPELPQSQPHLSGAARDVAGPFQDLHVQLSVVRHTDGLSACLVNGFPTTKKRVAASHRNESSAGVRGLKCVLMLIDNHAFLNFYW